jgi:hypothetical protein
MRSAAQELVNHSTSLSQKIASNTPRHAVAIPVAAMRVTRAGYAGSAACTIFKLSCALVSGAVHA